MSPPGHDERRPGGSGVSVGAGSTNVISVRRTTDSAQRRAWRIREFGPDVTVLLEGLDRRRAAQQRLQPLDDLAVAS